MESICVANGACMASRSSGFGFPMSSMTFSIWLSVDVPEKMAFPFIISPRIQPTLQMSTALEYL